MRLKFISLFFLISILLYIIYNKENFTAQAIGLILQYTESFNIKLAKVLSFFINIKSSMISIERCESALNTKSEKNPKEGIVGRTGSGKSSLINALFRLIEGFEGEILIDDININKLNLDFLRQHLTIVTQEPFLLEGTLKENIDPLNKYSENEIIEILNNFCLFNEIQNNYRRLRIEIKENGNNLSIGEKQLICFARAALKKSKVIILDEATSSLDINTEKIISKNMDILFKGCTVIMIAHHINIVEECDRIFVVDNGEIVENGIYDNLLSNKKSKFYELYSEIKF